MDSQNRGQISDTFFRRAFIPIMLTILALSVIIVLIAVPSGTPARWPTFSFASQKIFTGGNRIVR